MHRRRAGGGNVAPQPARSFRHGTWRDRPGESGQPGACLRRDRPGPWSAGRPAACAGEGRASSTCSWLAGRRRWRRSTTSRCSGSATASSCRTRCRQGQRLTGMSGNQSSLPLAGSQFGFGQHGANGTWVSDLLPHTAEDRRRPVHRALDVHRGDQPRSRDHVLPDRLADRRPAEHGLVDSLRPRAATTRICRRSSC